MQLDRLVSSSTTNHESWVTDFLDFCCAESEQPLFKLVFNFCVCYKNETFYVLTLVTVAGSKFLHALLKMGNRTASSTKGEIDGITADLWESGAKRTTNPHKITSSREMGDTVRHLKLKRALKFYPHNQALLSTLMTVYWLISFIIGIYHYLFEIIARISHKQKTTSNPAQGITDINDMSNLHNC